MLEPGQIFANRYRVIRRIAEGGMGAIFEAEHTATERKVALKLLFPHIMSVASARKKFELEARISARVNSPYIVEVLDAGFDEGSKSPFLVMELLEGETLCHHVRTRGALGIDEALPLLQQVAAGLDAAHGYKEPNGALKPIVHRDLKPENLFLAREHGNFSVKILDFGIAKVLGETGNVSQEVRGTPLYMAFEQVTAGALSPQTDVWAIGLIAYYMLTASHYWRSANEPTANVQSLFAEILTLPLEAPSVRLRQHNVNVALPAAFDSWLLECIHREPSRRFASAGAAVDALARAYGKNTKSRARLESARPATLGLAATEAFVAPAPTPAQQLGTAASLPGFASEHASLPVPAPEAIPPAKRWLAPAAAAAVVVLGGIGWLAIGGGGDSGGGSRKPDGSTHAASAAASAATPAAVAAAATAPAAAPTLPPAPASDGAPAAAAPAAPAPAAAAEPPSTSAGHSGQEPSPAPGTAPRVRVASPAEDDGPEPAAARASEGVGATNPSATNPGASKALVAPRPGPAARVTPPAPAAPARRAEPPPPRKAPAPASKKNKSSDAYRMR